MKNDGKRRGKQLIVEDDERGLADINKKAEDFIKNFRNQLRFNEKNRLNVSGRCQAGVPESYIYIKEYDCNIEQMVEFITSYSQLMVLVMNGG